MTLRTLTYGRYVWNLFLILGNAGLMSSTVLFLLLLLLLLLFIILFIYYYCYYYSYCYLLLLLLLLLSLLLFSLLLLLLLLLLSVLLLLLSREAPCVSCQGGRPLLGLEALSAVRKQVDEARGWEARARV